MQLTPRADKIIRILLRFSPDSPVTIGIISEELGVSDRSVQRELPTVEKWMKHNGFCFVRKRSVGLLIDETPERLKELAALLDEKDTNSSAPADNRPERLTLYVMTFSSQKSRLNLTTSQKSSRFPRVHLLLTLTSLKPGLQSIS